ncbi:hypothetical protein P43SY_004354 [Pythium insidiosum]|uniref:Reverse transcriptase n=1 Tax=Pythium insidiosum TaxID=114742 RepID=A0AAD5M1N8_PYTIN|nr:hypothetical protein P43SY_004354 [Pythium insidiosum]
MIGSRQRATLANRPQANGQQERSEQTVMHSVKTYVAESDQSDWEDVVHRLMFALNTSFDATRCETPFFLVHGWDPKSTVNAMPAPAPRSRNTLDAYAWRLRAQRQHQYVQAWARDLQRQTEQRRADQRTRAWEELADRFKTGLEVGNQVWLHLARTQPGLTRKLAHQWHGPLSVTETIESSSPRTRVYPWVHIGRLKPRVSWHDRPGDDVETDPGNDDDDLDAALLPEDSWQPDEEAGEYAVEELRDVRWVSSGTRSGRRHKEKWQGYDEQDWVREDQLSCGRLQYEFDQAHRARSRFAAMQSTEDRVQ